MGTNNYGMPPGNPDTATLGDQNAPGLWEQAKLSFQSTRESGSANEISERFQLIDAQRSTPTATNQFLDFMADEWRRDNTLDPQIFSQAFSRSANDQFKLSASALNDKYADSGVNFEDDMFQAEAEILVNRKRRVARRDRILSMAESGVLSTATNFTAGLAGALTDPGDVVLGSIPILGEARWAGVLGKLGGIGKRLAASKFAVRATSGAIENMAIDIPVQAAIFSSQANTFDLDVSMQDYIASVAMSSLVGGAARTVFGGIGDITTTRRIKRVNAKLTEARALRQETGDMQSRISRTNPETLGSVIEVATIEAAYGKVPVQANKILGLDPDFIGPQPRIIPEVVPTGRAADTGVLAQARKIKMQREVTPEASTKIQSKIDVSTKQLESSIRLQVGQLKRGSASILDAEDTVAELVKSGMPLKDAWTKVAGPEIAAKIDAGNSPSKVALAMKNQELRLEKTLAEISDAKTIQTTQEISNKLGKLTKGINTQVIRAASLEEKVGRYYDKTEGVEDINAFREVFGQDFKDIGEVNETLKTIRDEIDVSREAIIKGLDDARDISTEERASIKGQQEKEFHDDIDRGTGQNPEDFGQTAEQYIGSRNADSLNDTVQDFRERIEEFDEVNVDGIEVDIPVNPETKLVSGRRVDVLQRAEVVEALAENKAFSAEMRKLYGDDVFLRVKEKQPFTKEQVETIERLNEKVDKAAAQEEPTKARPIPLVKGKSTAVDAFKAGNPDRLYVNSGKPVYENLTFDPSGKDLVPQMSGENDGLNTVFSGVYARQTAFPGAVAIAGPGNPLSVALSRTANDLYSPDVMRQMAVSMMRDADDTLRGEGWSGKEVADYAEDLSEIINHATGKKISPADILASADRATALWQQHKQVAPINLMLSDLGFDGIQWKGSLAHYAQEFGDVKFPPTDSQGRVVGAERSAENDLVLRDKSPSKAPASPIKSSAFKKSGDIYSAPDGGFIELQDGMYSLVDGIKGEDLSTFNSLKEAKDAWEIHKELDSRFNGSKTITVGGYTARMKTWNKLELEGRKDTNIKGILKDGVWEVSVNGKVLGKDASPRASLSKALEGAKLKAKIDEPSIQKVMSEGTDITKPRIPEPILKAAPEPVLDTKGFNQDVSDEALVRFDRNNPESVKQFNTLIKEWDAQNGRSRKNLQDMDKDELVNTFMLDELMDPHTYGGKNKSLARFLDEKGFEGIHTVGDERYVFDKQAIRQEDIQTNPKKAPEKAAQARKQAGEVGKLADGVHKELSDLADEQEYLRFVKEVEEAVPQDRAKAKQLSDEVFGEMEQAFKDLDVDVTKYDWRGELEAIKRDTQDSFRLVDSLTAFARCRRR